MLQKQDSSRKSWASSSILDRMVDFSAKFLVRCLFVGTLVCVICVSQNTLFYSVFELWTWNNLNLKFRFWIIFFKQNKRFCVNLAYSGDVVISGRFVFSLNRFFLVVWKKGYFSTFFDCWNDFLIAEMFSAKNYSKKILKNGQKYPTEQWTSHHTTAVQFLVKHFSTWINITKLTLYRALVIIDKQ